LQAKLDAERTESVEALNRVNALEAKLAAEKKDREDAQFEGHRLRAQLAAATIEPTKKWECSSKDCPTLRHYKEHLAAAELNFEAESALRTQAGDRITALEQKYTALEKDYNAAYEKLAAAEADVRQLNEKLIAADKYWKARISTLEKELAMVEDAANKGDKARKEAGGMEEHIADLKLEVDECYAWINELQAELDDSDKCYEEDRKTIESLLAQRDKLANEVNRLQTALDGAADLMIGGVEGPVESAITPGVYWTREKSRTRNDLRKKHNLPEWLVYQMEWDGHHWSNKSGWTHITMEQFVADGWQLGPRVENEPKDEQYHEVN
jgi:chromosome segregation ATPase